MKRSHLLLLFLAVSLGVLIFLLWPPAGQTLFCQDTSPVILRNAALPLKSGSWAVWHSDTWLGLGDGPVLLNPQLPFSLLPIEWSNSVVAGLGSLFFGLNTLLLCRQLRLNFFSCLFAGLAAAFSSHSLTLVFPGHINKIVTYGFIPLACMGFLKWIETQKWPPLLLAGFGLGLAMQSGETPIAYFTGLWFAAFSLFLCFKPLDPNSRFPQKLKLGAGLVLIVLVVGGVAAQTVLKSYFVVSNLKPVSGGEDTAQNWQFATQFFFPPEEILSYFTTIQFFGAPNVYWGRDGIPTPLRLSDDYMGLLPLGFAILGGIACWRLWQARFFVIMGLGSLLISFGREGGLFWLVYQLPTMKSQRNPHRWTFFVAFSVCVLAAYGVNWLWNQLRSAQHPKEKAGLQSFRWKRCLMRVGIMGIILFTISGFLWMNERSLAGSLYPGLDHLTPQQGLFLERFHLVLVSLARTGLFLTLSAGSVWWLIRTNVGDQASSLERRACWGALILVLLLDLGANAKRFIYFYPWKDYYEKNAVADYLRKDHDLYRVEALGTMEHPLLNDLVTNILPFYHIPVVHPPAIAWLPGEYEHLFGYIKNHLVRSDRYFEFFNVKYLLCLKPFSDPYVSWKHIAEWEGVYLYLNEKFMPRAWLAASAKVVAEGDEAVLAATFHPSLNLRETVVLEENPSSLPSLEKPSSFELRASGSPPSAQIVRHEDDRVEIETVSNAPAMLVLSEKWNPDWKAWLDGKPVKIYKANFLMRGVEVPSGDHKILMEYRPSMVHFRISAAFISLFILLGIIHLGRLILLKKPSNATLNGL